MNENKRPFLYYVFLISLFGIHVWSAVIYSDIFNPIIGIISLFFPVFSEILLTIQLLIHHGGLWNLWFMSMIFILFWYLIYAIVIYIKIKRINDLEENI